jgi:hypothetical protein
MIGENNMMSYFETIFSEFGLPGLIGIALGLWLFGSQVRGAQGNVFGVTPWHPLHAALVGGFVFGFGIWFVIGFFLGFQAVQAG